MEQMEQPFGARPWNMEDGYNQIVFIVSLTGSLPHGCRNQYPDIVFLGDFAVQCSGVALATCMPKSVPGYSFPCNGVGWPGKCLQVVTC